MAVVLIGFMGAGKSTAARKAGGVDTDELIERSIGEPISTFFEREGEAAFRAREEQEVLAALDGRADVVALGGGALGSPRVRAALADHVVALLEVEVETAWSRVGGGGRADRPLARDRDAFAALHAERRELYESVADAFVDGGRPFDDQALAALRSLRRGERLIWSRVHPVWFDRPIDPLPGDFVISDENVAPLHAPGAYTIPAGEQHKTLAVVEQTWREMARRGITRSGRVVAVGGGVVGDLAGFCASAYQRGIPVVQVPTTLVAQVDSAYGGKTGVDLPEAKNYVGAYHQPASVHVLRSTLSTLPVGERAAGYTEVVKTALIAGGRLWQRVREGAIDDPDVILACARTKLALVAADERDTGVRQVLNLGHTIGHAIETVTAYGRYRHGEAIALGLLAALRLSSLDELRSEVAELLAAQHLATVLEGVDPDAVVAATYRDKKRLAEGGPPYVLVAAPGDVTPGHQVAEERVRDAVAELADGMRRS